MEPEPSCVSGRAQAEFDRELTRLDIFYLRRWLRLGDPPALSVYGLDSADCYFVAGGQVYRLSPQERQLLQYELAGYFACNLVNYVGGQFGSLYVRRSEL